MSGVGIKKYDYTHTQSHKNGTPYWETIGSSKKITHIYQIPTIRVYPSVLKELSRLLPARTEEKKRGEQGFISLMFEGSSGPECSTKRCFFGKSTNGRSKYLTFKFLGKESDSKRSDFELHFHLIRENPPTKHEAEYDQYQPDLEQDFTVYDLPQDVSKHTRKLSKDSPYEPYKSLKELVVALKFYKNLFISEISKNKYILKDDEDEDEDSSDMSLSILSELKDDPNDDYDDTSVNDLLAYYVTTGSISNLVRLDALPLQSEAGITSELIQGRITAAMALHPTIMRFYLPLRINNNHWIGLYIDRTEDNPLVYWVDPYGGLLHERKVQIRNILNATGIFNIDLTLEHIHFQEFQLQEDGVNCGPWVVEILRFICEKGRFPNPGLDKINIEALRNQHYDILHGPSTSSSFVDKFD